MESDELMICPEVSESDATVLPHRNSLERTYSEDRKVQVSITEEEKGEIADELLEGFEEYWVDINERLLISRMVSDSVIRGMVTAVEQETTEKIAEKELEVARLQGYLQSCEVDAGTCDAKLPIGVKSPEMCKSGRFHCITEICTKHGNMREDLLALKKVAHEQFEKAKKEVECPRGGISMKKAGSVSKLVGLGGILQKNCSMHDDNMVESLNRAVDSVCSTMEDILLSSEALLRDSQQDFDLLVKLEGMVMRSVLLGFQEENFLHQTDQLHGIQTVNWLEKFDDISGLITHLHAIKNSLFAHETALVSHGSQDLDHLHNKAFGNHSSPPSSFCGEDGKLDEPIIRVAESYDYQQLKHMTHKELVDYFKEAITMQKRDHEAALQQKTEECFCLKRENLKLKEMVSSVAQRKDEEFDLPRKKFPEIISKLETFLLENERFPALLQNFENIEKMKLRLDCLLIENQQLRNSLNDKENEVKCLQVQVSSASEELLRSSLAEENMLKLVDDSFVETSLTEDVYKSVLREQITQTRCNFEDSSMEFLMATELRDIIIREAGVGPAETAERDGIEDSDVELWMVQGVSGLIFTEAIKDAEFLINDLHKEAFTDKQMRCSLETEAREIENELRLEVEENMKLKHDIQELRTVLQDKEKLGMILSISLSKEREELQLAFRELCSLREHANHLEELVADSSIGFELFKSQYLEAIDLIEVKKMELHTLQQELYLTKEILTETNKRALTLSEETSRKLQLSEFREEKLKREMKWAMSELLNLFHDFEWKIAGAFIKTSFRIEDSKSHLKGLNKMANDLRRSELTYKQQLDSKCANLQMAEAEVDLLGDEVDSLLSLLKKTYIALDHYSPVLKHYPGIIDILELVRRELSG